MSEHIDCYHCGEEVRKSACLPCVHDDTGKRVFICPYCVFAQSDSQEVSDDL